MKGQSDTEQLLCALMFMLTRQAKNPGVPLAVPIRDHLDWLASHPDTAKQPMLRKTCHRLMVQWQEQCQQTSGTGRAASAASRVDLH